MFESLDESQSFIFVFVFVSNKNLCISASLTFYYFVCFFIIWPYSFRSEESINTAGFYNYGVPSNKPKQSTPIKRHRSTSESPSRIQVCVRKRPLSQAELNANEEDVLTVTSSTTIELTVPKLAVDLTKYTQKVYFYNSVRSCLSCCSINNS